MEMGKTDFFQEAIQFARMLKVPDAFVHELKKEDDWTFVIKSHFLLEGAISCLLTKLLRDDRLADVLTEIELSKKIEMLSVMEVFDAETRGFMRALSRLRNQLVHRLMNATFTFQEYLKDPNRRKTFVKDFGFIWVDPIDFGMGPVSREEFTLDNPKHTLFMGVYTLLAYCKYEHDLVQVQGLKALMPKGFLDLILNERAGK
jgi:hypothetical protein